MIIDKLENGAQYAALHPNFKVAFDYLLSTDLAALEVGKFDIAEGVKAIVSDKDGVTAETAGEKFECHNKNIDIQLCIRGNETMGWKPRTDCTQPKGEFNEEKDVIFYADKPDMYFSLKGGQFVIFYPNDVHAPMIGVGPIKKLVVKVAI
ncbi:YhcH/YjgK/YiaL family protein [Mucilaginibacter boryungensis]|uniref:YhcH/YjgK/YiaL family protein n=1 Tax=Mucilaginibacter boryungensis TaxID=768480 RepID=A0ABR9XDR2_9SPHI|nr:YhcH/YjgK/YiaL family protein [Mucilaginibacter boryungensis]MBE9665214.1 YhcH/YjgK/YiaL family protein [Mucilaginibacter boryungensis]